ncbi:MAG: hypothetical protein Fur0032_22170 [Terrimicrobiaceae bacterium]
MKDEVNGLCRASLVEFISEKCKLKEHGHSARVVGGRGRDAHAPLQTPLHFSEMRPALQQKIPD